MNLNERATLNKGDFLINDRIKNGAGAFERELIRFGSESSRIEKRLSNIF
ncbi:MAG: hypothetical protein LBH77_06095 [Tannerella sp.]|jgi:hypothetical protein|nr:hypothetical protein [Tannerella sp.]